MTRILQQNERISLSAAAIVLFASRVAAMAMPAALAASKPAAAPSLLATRGVESWATFGAFPTQRLSIDPSAPGGNSLRLRSQAGQRAWEAGVYVNVPRAVRPADVVGVAFWAKAATSSRVVIVPGRLQSNDAPYAAFGEETLRLTSRWRLYRFSGRVVAGAGPLRTGLVLHLGGVAQTVDLGPVYMTIGGSAPTLRALRAAAGRVRRDHVAEDVMIRNPTDGVQLAATLRRPLGRDRVPLVILGPGSGSHVRSDRLFDALNDMLLASGVATLEFDKRGFGRSGGKADDTDIALAASDVEAMLDRSKEFSHIDRRRIGVLGVSLGGRVGPIVAVHRPDLAFLVLLCAPAMREEERALLLTERALAMTGGTDSALEGQLMRLRGVAAMINAVRQSTDDDSARRSIHAIIEEWIRQGVMDQERATALERSINVATVRAEAAVDPQRVLARVRAPVLFVGGSDDTLVPSDVNTPLVRAALATSRDARVTILPGLDHALTRVPRDQTAGTAASPYSDPSALNVIRTWLRARGFTRPSATPSAGPARRSPPEAM